MGTEITMYAGNGRGERTSSYHTADHRFEVAVHPSEAADNEAAFALATRLAVSEAEAEVAQQIIADLRSRIVEQKAEPARLMGEGCVRFTSTGELWILNRRDGGFASFGFRCDSWDDLFRRYDVRVTGTGTDEHGMYWTVASMR